MPLVTFANVAKSYGQRRILKGATFSVGEHERIGLVGPNGTGKSTIFNLIVRELHEDEGDISLTTGLTVGYLHQEFRPDSTLGLHAYVLQAFRDVLELERTMREVEHALADNPRDEKLLRRLGELQHQFDAADGYTVESRASRVLAGLGFGQDQFDSPVQTLSGGEQTKAALARILVEEPDLLLLDEPTNHLDLWALAWLEEFLIEFKGSVIVISHDRYFLDRVATRILELREKRVFSFKGNYSEYAAAREKLDLETRRRYDQQQAFIAHQEDYIRRYGAVKRATSTHGRERLLEKLERIELPAARKKAAIRFDGAERTTYMVYSARGLSKSFDGKPLFRNVALQVTRGDRLGIIGPNGCGKTTLLKILLGMEKPDAGDVVRGNLVSVGYFDQKQLTLDPRRSVLDEIWSCDPDAKEGQIRSLAARFLFRGDDVLKPVSILSGGEKGMLALAKIMAARPAVMVLDEPTNHLDIDSREAFEQALCEFDGTLILVSHDRRLLDSAVDQIVVMRPDGCRAYLGNYSFYVEQEAREKAEAEARAAPVREAARKADPRAEKKQAQRERRRIEREMEKLEADIAALEAAILEINQAFEHDPEIYKDADRLRETARRLRENQNQFKAATEAWSRLVDQLDGLPED